MTQDVDIVVVGAGSAGLAAAHTALSLGLTVQVLEAKGRIGGRAFTDEIAGMPWDRGAYWLHDAHNNFYAAYAGEIGFTFDRMMRSQHFWSAGAWADDALKLDRDAFYDAAFDAVDRAGEAGLDIAASQVIADHPRWRPMFDSWYAALSGAEPEYCSTLDQSRYADGENFRVRPGYGALVTEYGKGLPISLSSPVERIRWGSAGVRVETAKGTLRCRAVIVAISTTALMRGGVRFDPVLPSTVCEAIESLPLGTAEKVAIAFDRDTFGLPDNSHVHSEHATRETLRFQIKPGGHAIAVGYLAGRFAEELEAAGEPAMVDFTERKLVEVFGSDILRARVGAAATHWRSDPHIGGGYSYAVPGAAEQRKIFRQPVGERIVFAGEACALTAFGTVHGAHRAGVKAAQNAEAFIRGKVAV